MAALSRSGAVLVAAAMTGSVLVWTSPAAVAVERSNRVVEKIVIGKSVEERKLWAYRKGNPDATQKVVVLGQMHGDERAGVRTARYIKNQVPVSLSADVWIVPTMNPDGLDADSRYNANGVDLNRNFPTGWTRRPHGGRGPASAPETRAMIRLLKRVKPRFIASMHQPFGVVARSDKNMPYTRRLSDQLGLPIRRVDIGPCHGPDCPPSPTMTDWYNTRQPGTSVTIEYTARPSVRFKTVRAGYGLLRAARAY